MNENNESKELQIEEEEKKDPKSAVNDLFKKASIMGKKVADNVQKNASALSERAKNDSYQRRLEKFNPLFTKEFKSKSFTLPSLIKIVDDCSIQSIDVCEGAIGWRDRSGDIEILFLSADYANKTDLQFFPNMTIGAFFCADTFEPARFINIERVFTRAHEEKLAELEHIAFSLGAKSCSIELVESDEFSDTKNRDGQASMKILSASSKEKSKEISSHSMSGRTISTFAGNNVAVPPNLKWFKDDHNILNLIEMRCSDSNSIKSRTLILEGSSSATMEHNMARKIDLITSKFGFKLHTSMEKQCRKEYTSRLIYEVEF